jgi:RNA polymerase sigma-70 factor (ECF subfamily)
MGEGELELIQQALQGDIDAWGEIVRRYKSAVFGVALGILGNPADAEDAAQDAFIRAFENLHRYDLKRKFSTWLFTVTANLCKNKLRREKFFTPLKNLAQLRGPAEDPAEQVAREEREALVQQALQSLDEKYRAPLVLRFYGDLDYKEIAQALSLPEGTVKTRIHRGKAALKRWLETKGVKGNA